MSAAILDFGRDPAKTLRRKFAEFVQQAQADAERARRNKEMDNFYVAYAARRNPKDDGPKAA